MSHLGANSSNQNRHRTPILHSVWAEHVGCEFENPSACTHYLKSQCAEGLEESLTLGAAMKLNGCVWVPVPRLIELLSAATACSEELKPKGIYLWGTVISAQVKAKQSRQGQERTGHFSRQRWQRVERAQCWWVSAPSRGSQALLHGQQCAVDSFVLPWSNFHSIHSSAESQREHTWGMTTRETYFVYSLLRSVLPGLWCLWLWQRQLLLNSTHGEPNMTKPCYKKRTYKEMMRLWWNSHHTGEKRNQHNRSCNFSEKLSLLRT